MPFPLAYVIWLSLILQSFKLKFQRYLQKFLEQKFCYFSVVNYWCPAETVGGIIKASIAYPLKGEKLKMIQRGDMYRYIR